MDRLASRPRLAGDLKATQLALQVPSSASSGSATPQFFTLDSVEATGSYSPSRIVIDRGNFTRGAASSLRLSGTLDATPAPRSPAGPAHCLYSIATPLSTRAWKLPKSASMPIGPALDPLFKGKMPFTGTLAAQVRADGPLHAPEGSGWIELQNGTIYSEPVPSARGAGNIFQSGVEPLPPAPPVWMAAPYRATGSFDFATGQLKASANGRRLEISRVGWLQRHHSPVTGDLLRGLRGRARSAEPHIEAHADSISLVLAGQPMGSLEATAHSAGHTLDL